MHLPYIAQVEFFRLQETENLEKLQIECIGRWLDGVDIKTSVRFYDEGSLLRLVAEHERVHGYKKRILKKFSRKKNFWLMGKYLAWEYGRLSRQCDNLRQQATRLAAHKLAVALRSGEPVAIDYDYRQPLRWVREDEAHELLESVRKSQHAWIFIFEHNELRADVCTIVSSITIGL